MTNDPTPSDEQLAIRAQGGDRHAFERLVQKYKGPLYRLARSHIGSEADCYDIVQDTFISAWLALRRFDRRKAFAVWLRTIALNKCRDHGRRQGVRRRFLRYFAPRGAELSTAPEPEQDRERDALEEVRLQRLDQAVSALPDFYKEPLLLTTVGGLSQQQAAEQLNTTAKAVEMRIRRARKKLTEALSDLKRSD